MNYDWDNLKREFNDFNRFSSGYGYIIQESENGNSIRARLEKDEHVFFLLENENQCCRLEFVIQYGNHRSSIVNAIKEIIPIRDFHYHIHYTDSHWIYRRRIIDANELIEDLEKSFAIIHPSLDNRNLDPPIAAPVKICSNVTAAELLTWELRIPDYQRPYSWREKNIRDFLVDISLWQTDENKNGISYHLGTIILKEQKWENGEVYFDVIDGQQRLTTLAIIANNKGKDIPILGTVKKYTESEIQVLLRARNYIKNSKIEIKFEQIELAVVILGQNQREDLAYTFFSNSNSTGKHLSDYDLLKTHHLRYISKGTEAERFSKHWHDLEKSGKQDEVLQCMLFRLRKWINNESFPLDANNRESRELFYHYKSVDPLLNCSFGEKTLFRFNSLLSGGNEFFSYTKYYRKKYDEFMQYEEIEDLTKALSWHSNGVIFSGIKAIAFLFFCKFGEMYLKEAVYLLAYRLSVLRNEIQVRSAYLSNEEKGAIFREITRQLDQVTSAAQFFALLSDVKKRYAETNTGNAARRYWTSLHALMNLLEEKNLAIAKIK